MLRLLLVIGTTASKMASPLYEPIHVYKPLAPDISIAEKVPCQRNRQPGPRSCANRRLPRSAARTNRVSRGAISNWTWSAFLERMPRQTRHLHAHAVNRSVCGEEQRLHVRSAKGEIGRHFGRLDRADMGAVRRVNPGAAGAGAIDVALHIDLHPVRHADL